MIVTHNLGDFPSHTLGSFNIEAQHPDDFVMAVLEAFPEVVLEAARNHRASLKNPPKTPDEYLSELDAQGLEKTVIALREFLSERASVI